MAIRIKSPEIHALAKTLALLTGQTQVAAVTTALEERLARINAEEMAAGQQSEKRCDEQDRT